MNYRYLMLIATLALTACEDKKIYDVQYYVDHEKEREAMLEKCKNNPGELSKDANCINVHAALWKIPAKPFDFSKILEKAKKRTEAEEKKSKPE